MNLSYLKNNKGLTITELIVTMGISAILLIFIISGSLFIKNYLKKQSQKSKIFEELSFVLSELDNTISNGRELVLKNDSLIVISKSGLQTTYTWMNKRFMRNSHNLSTSGMKIDSLGIHKIRLLKQANSTILNQKKKITKSGAYELFIKISDSENRTDSLKTIIINNYENVKYSQ